MPNNIKYLGNILEPLDFFSSTFADRQQHIEDLLCRNLNTKTVVAFIGSGTSIPLGYPSWTGFASDILKIAKILFEFPLLFKREKSEDLDRLLKDVKSENKVFLTDLFSNFQVKNETKINSEIEKLIRDTYFLMRNELMGQIDEEINALKQKPKDKINSINNWLNYIENGRGEEFNAQIILNECERLFCTDKYWVKNKQSKIFRFIVKIYFHFRHKNASEILRDEQSVISDEKRNQYIALLKLPIKKFVTPNYDLEIERALLLTNKLPASDTFTSDKTDFSEEEIIKLTGNKSFSQRSKNCRSLAQFSISRYDESRHSVFHCHGRIDDVGSCVITEEDYQTWYLRENAKESDTNAIPFRQTIDLTLDSNPILFMGFGLKDADLMRILRLITANSPVEKNRNPLFCLLYVGKNEVANGIESFEANYKTKQKTAKWKNRLEIEDECTALYIKYGLHVIPVYVRDEQKDNPGCDAICSKIIKLHSKWRDWWDGIMQKPKFRKPPTEEKQQPISYFHYRFKLDNFISQVDKTLFDRLDTILHIDRKKIYISTSHRKEQLKGDKQPFAKYLAMIVGNGGAGKSWGVQKYLQDLEAKGWNVFFWSSYYGNDVLTGINRLIEFFSADKDKIFLESLKDIVDNEDAVIVFDGIEKLLNPNEENTEGESVSPEIKNFFKVISNGKVKAKIILTSRILPTDLLINLNEKIKKEEERNLQGSEDLMDLRSKILKTNIISAPKCWTEHLKKSGSDKFFDEFKELSEEDVSTICSLVDGHVFGISLVRGIIKNLNAGPQSEFQEKIRSLIRNIANTPVDRRVQRVISESIRSLQKASGFKGKDRFFQGFIERIALFMHPVRKEIAEVCFDQLMESFDQLMESVETKSLHFEQVLKSFVEASLIQTIIIKSQEEHYVVHPLVRSYIFETVHKSLFTSSLPSLQLPGFTSGREVVDPGALQGVNVSITIFNKLCESSKLHRKKADSKKASAKAEDYKVSVDMCRAAFSVLRSRFCSNTVARWGNYDEYLRLVVRLYDTAKEISTSHWKHNEPTNSGMKKSVAEDFAPLYPDELSWVYNEIGLVSRSMGNNLNASALWEQGYEISKLIDRDREGRYLFQSNFSLGTIYIYYGKLNYAKRYLNDALEIANKLENKKLANRVVGFIALTKYLQGNLEEADTDFKNACEGLTNNQRARAVFYGYHGELMLKMGKLDEAQKKIEESRHLAESEYYPDLIEYSRLASAKLFFLRQQYADAQVAYQFVLAFAREKSIRQMEAEALSGLSRLSNELGDFQTARLRAVESLKISNEYLLSLHQTVGLIVLGKALMSGDQYQFGVSCMETARDLAKAQGYFLRFNEAEKELQKRKIYEVMS